MIATTALTDVKTGRLGVMVRTPTELFAYWKLNSAVGPLTVRVTDLTGLPAHDCLDGVGYRDVTAERSDATYVLGLMPGHLYMVEVGTGRGSEFQSLIAAGPVQTPWLARADFGGFPAPYHRS